MILVRRPVINTHKLNEQTNIVTLADNMRTNVSNHLQLMLFTMCEGKKLGQVNARLAKLGRRLER